MSAQVSALTCSQEQVHQAAGTRSSPAFGKLRLVTITHFCLAAANQGTGLTAACRKCHSKNLHHICSAVVASWKLPGEKKEKALLLRLGVPNKWSRVWPSQLPEQPPGPCTARGCCQGRKIRAGGSSGLILSHGTSLGLSLKNHFASLLLHFPATGNDGNLWNWSKNQNCLFQGSISHLFHFHGVGVTPHFSVFFLTFSTLRVIWKT